MNTHETRELCAEERLTLAIDALKRGDTAEASVHAAICQMHATLALYTFLRDGVVATAAP